MNPLTEAEIKARYGKGARVLQMLPPSGMENCDPLAVMPVDDGRLVSFWRPTAEELKQLNEGAPIALHIYAARQPPVSVTVF